jgi:PAS domain S-box-containing protein
MMDHPKRNRPKISDPAAELRRRAEARLSERQNVSKSDFSGQRLLHEFEVHQVELEMQNAELQKTRDELELTLVKFTDLYDFAPVGYFSIDESGVVREANLKSAALLGMVRSRLINRSLLLFVDQTSRPIIEAFLKRVFTESEDQECEAVLLREGEGSFQAAIRGTSALNLEGKQSWCRVAFGDITARKQAEEVQRRLEALANTNLGLNREIVRRQTVEHALQKSEQEQTQLLKQSRNMQGQLRHLSHQILKAQEEERKRISRELHDKIAQALVSINYHLEALTRERAGKPGSLRQRIARTQHLVQKSMGLVHVFARELRPPALDDLGLIPALQGLLKEFTKRTGVRTRLMAFAAIEQLNIDKRTILYRVAHEALNNVGRHAQASLAEVSIEKLAESISMKIKDNGKSFDVESVLHTNRGRRLGLLGMRERLEMVGGNFLVESAPGKGTIVRAQIPVGKARAARQRKTC